jgi:hypothetical protein
MLAYLGRANMLYSEVGSVRSIEGKEYVCTERGDTGYALFGPYMRFAPGSYIVTFEFLTETDSCQNISRKQVCCTVDVAADSGNMILAKSEISSDRLSAQSNDRRVVRLVAIQIHFL